MQADNLSRGLLAAILVSLVVLIAEHRGTDASTAVPAPATERFEVHPITLRRGPPMLLRVDTATGQAWTMGLMDAPTWIPLAEASDGAPVPDTIVPGRFSIRDYQQTRGLPTLVRTDSVTGLTWRKGSKTNQAWVVVPNPDPNSTPLTKAAPTAAAPGPSAVDRAATGTATAGILEVVPGLDAEDQDGPDGD